MNLIPGLTPGAEIAPLPQAQGNCLVYIGTRPGGKSKGIYLCRLDPVTGTLTSPEVAAETTDPGFLAIRPDHRFLYSVRESAGFDSTPNGAVSAFAIDEASGKLTLVNQQSSGDRGPCHLAIDQSGQCLLVAHYGAGSVAMLPIRMDGSLGTVTTLIKHQGSGADPKRQQTPHAHSVGFDLINHHALSADLGADKIFVYQFDSTTAALTTNNPSAAALAPGSGPRHFVFHPDGRHLYAINELNSTVTAFNYNASRGGLKEIQTISTLPDNFTGPNTGAEIAIHPNGRFLYGSNRGHDSIVVYAVDESTGKLTLVEHQSTQGKTPRNFGIDPTGNFLLAANQDSDSIVVFRIDPKTGRLQATGQTLEVPAPVCVTFAALP